MTLVSKRTKKEEIYNAYVSQYPQENKKYNQSQCDQCDKFRHISNSSYIHSLFEGISRIDRLDNELYNYESPVLRVRFVNI